jgi:carbon-monoxide dehydrogenase medium subunit
MLPRRWQFRHIPHRSATIQHQPEGESVKAPRFNYFRPESLSEAVHLLGENAEDGRILAGGQSLIPTLNMRLSQPKVLIDINRIEELRGISMQGDMVRIGALTRHVEVMNSPLVAQHLPLIAEAMPYVAHVAVRNRGTFGGSIALADPSAEMPACVLALGASVVVQSVRGRRTIQADEFFLDLYETARNPDELLVEVLIPQQKSDHVSVFMELSIRHGDFAIAGLALYGRIDGDTVQDMRLVYFGSEAKPTLAKQAMAALNGKSWSKQTSEAVRDALGRDLAPIPNTFGSAATKLHLQRVLTQRALDKAAERARHK